MPCYHPLKAFYRNDGDKKDIIFANQGQLDKGYAEKNGNLYATPIDIPCGQCIGCRLEYSRQWAVRCVLEAR